jgi:hypothetical protein
MSLISRLFAAAGITRRATPADDARKRRRKLGKQLMTPEREALIARAMAVRQAKQDLLGDLADSAGTKRVADVIRRMMDDKR